LVTAVGCYYDIAENKGQAISETLRKEALKKAIDLSRKLFSVYEYDYQVYTQSVEPEFQMYYNSEIEQAQDILRRLYFYAMNYAEKEKDSALKAELKKMEENFRMRTQNIFGPMSESGAPVERSEPLNDSSR
jgi:hypothetical protein